LLIYSLLGLFNLYSLSNIPWRGTLTFSIFPLSYFVIQHYFISAKIKSRLIYKIQEVNDAFILTIYNKSTIKINKSELPLEKEPRDYFIRSLFGTRTGTINILSKNNDTCVIKIDNKKYYLAPNLFEREVTI
jgi:hypothetical protein